MLASNDFNACISLNLMRAQCPAIERATRPSGSCASIKKEPNKNHLNFYTFLKEGLFLFVPHLCVCVFE